jgi:hypothetical protein
MKKRILVLLTVVALMVVLLAMSVAPAFAQGEPVETGGGPTRVLHCAPSVIGVEGIHGVIVLNEQGQVTFCRLTPGQ